VKVEDVFQIGKWLIFKPGTCFGNTKQHLGVIAGIDRDTKEIAVAVNATSQVQKRVEFAIARNFPVSTHVNIAPGTNIHFSKLTVIDCNMAQRITYAEVENWVNLGLIEVIGFNEDVSDSLMQQIKVGIKNSPRNVQKLKDMIDL
jgi:hypothetical protein